MNISLNGLFPLGFHLVFSISCYIIKTYKDTKNIDNKNDKAKFRDKKDLILERKIAASILKIREIANSYFQKKEPNLKTQRRNNLNNNSSIYLKLCQQTLKLSEESSNYAIDQVLSTLDITLTKEQFYKKLQSIPPKILQQLFLELFQPTEAEKTIELATLKEAKIFLYNVTMNVHKELLSELEALQNISEEEFNKRKGMFLFVNHIKVNDMLYMKYGLEEDRLEMLCLKNGLSDDNEKKEADEQLKNIDKVK